ncbi:aliphatic sulfonate ABC transporter substrate-binding protein [Clostridium sp. UBA1652]|uniref:taurine ABC transporter substrate-binding protein n=1 Tax=Clostridium sp. UBA1652 TaxID=1946348 RepID=UPI00257C59C3|nr:aliphatic sulfonate ABC transporter substrate-binding protein [Clostridium sp. UBA1652]
MKKRKSLISLISIILLGIMVFMTGCGKKENAQGDSTDKNGDLPKEIRIGYMVSPNGELLAKAKGSVEKKFPDIKINWVKFDAGRDIITALAGGSLDLGTIGTPPAALGIANGLPYDVYYLHDIIGDSEALVVKKDSGITSIKDLKGKKIATTFSSTSHFSLLNALKLNRISESEITLLDMQMPDINAAWTRGDIDGAYVWETTKTKLVNDGGNVIITSADLAKQGAITGELGIVQKDFASKYPDVLKDYISVLDESVNDYKNKQDESSELLSKELGLSKEEALKTMNQIIVLNKKDQTDKKYLGTASKPGEFGKLLKDTGDYLVTQKAIKSSPDLEVYQKSILNSLYD